MTDSNALKPIDVTAPTLEQAIEQGLARLGLSRDDVIIEIIEEGSRGVLGMGARDASVRLTPLRTPPSQKQPPVPKPLPRSEPEKRSRPEPERRPRPEPERRSQPAPKAAPPPVRHEPEEEDDEEALAPAPARWTGPVDREAEMAREVLQELLTHMGIEATIDIYRAEQSLPDEEIPWVLDVHGRDLGILIGRRGETLNALQYVTRLIVSRETQQRANIVIDVEGYKARRESALRKLALRMAKQVKQRGRPITLEPMPPNERRIIHITLREDQSVTTESVGTGDQRKVTIFPVSRSDM
jgi:spoIIIJ-associated protein